MRDKLFFGTWQYLLENKAYLENREDGKMKGSKWYAYIYPKNFDVISLPKIFTQILLLNLLSLLTYQVNAILRVAQQVAMAF